MHKETVLQEQSRFRYAGSVLVCGLFGCAWLTSSAWAQRSTDVGAEMSSIEKDVQNVQLATESVAPAVEASGTLAEGDSEAPLPQDGDEGATRAATHAGRFLLTGDWNVLKVENLFHAFEMALEKTELKPEAVQQVLAEYQQTLINRGYLLARLVSKGTVLAGGGQSMEIHIDVGRYGDLSLYSILLTPEGVPVRDTFQERYFSAKQIQRKFSGFTGERPFNYNDFYRSLYDLNMHPDLTLNARLRLRQDEQRYIDMEMTVEENLPLHAILEISNTGTESTKEWRAGLTFQHLNLLRQDDVLTLRGINATDFSSLNSLALSYRIPHYMGHGGAFSVVSGFSRIDSEEIFQDISIRGSGWFTGVQGAQRVYDSSRHLITLGLGGVYRSMEDQLVFADTKGAKREADALPVSLSISYASKRDDALFGRNYLTLESAYNMGAALDMSSDEQFNNLRQNAEESYYIQRVQIARLQSLYFGAAPKTTSKDWSLFLKVEGQVADGALIPAEQFAVGGMNTVRGYEERTLLGDHGAVATLELRAPILQDLATRPFGRQASGQDPKTFVDRMQMLLFVDAGFISRSELLQGEEGTESIASAGVGFRWALSRYAQVRADVGYRFEELYEQDRGVGFHLSAQLQY